MYDKFLTNNSPKAGQIIEKHYAFDGEINTEIQTLFEECGGYSFKNGLYKVHNPDSSVHWSSIIGNYFAQYKGRIIPFGYDWLGRQFAVDVARKNFILMFDPSTAESLELNQNIVSFHNLDLVDDIDSFLSEEHFHKVIKTMGLKEVKYGECIGHKISLFLNGSDTIDNYEIIDMEVYWEFECQIYLQIKNLPPGTKINSVKFE
jgi:hypothetical protein